MIRAESFIRAAKSRGFDFYAGVPCSYLTPLIDHTIEARGIRYVGAANEGEAVSIAAGASLAGKRGVAMFQNSGLGNAVSPLVSLCATFRAPVLLICTWRGEPEGAPDEPQHELMGGITLQLLELMRIPWEFFPREESGIGPALERAVRSMDASGYSYALVMRKDSVIGQPRQGCSPSRAQNPPLVAPRADGPRPSRRAVLTAIKRHCSDAALVATTGYMGRSLYETGDTERQLYVVGGMGCASSVGLGLALAVRSKRVVVLDGDGAALMRLGAFATIGHYRPENLVHVVLDNEAHESTGGQETVSGTTDLAAVAAACGYVRVVRASSVEDAAESAASSGKLTFVHVKVQPERGTVPPRPNIQPSVAAARFREWFARSTKSYESENTGGC